MEPCYKFGVRDARHDWAMWRLQHNPTNKYCAAQFLAWAASQHGAIYRAKGHLPGYVRGYYAYVHSLVQ